MIKKPALALFVILFALSITFVPEPVSALQQCGENDCNGYTSYQCEDSCDSWWWNGVQRCSGDTIIECSYDGCSGQWVSGVNCGWCGCTQSGTSAWCTNTAVDNNCFNDGWGGARKCSGKTIQECYYNRICGFYYDVQTCSYDCTEWWETAHAHTDAACISDPCSGVACVEYCNINGEGGTSYYNGACSGGSCYYSSTGCGSDYSGNLYCSNGKSCSIYHARGCYGGNCYDNPTEYCDDCSYGCNPNTGDCFYCGDGVCSSSYENCNCADCPCSSGYHCSAGVCVLDCTNECTSGATQCIGYTKQTCGNYDADACTEWGGDSVCSVGCRYGDCISGTYACADGEAHCTRVATGVCGASNCGNVPDYRCYAYQRCNGYDFCVTGEEGVKVCNECVLDSNCCTEGIAGDTNYCNECNAYYGYNYYSSSGHCCAKGSNWELTAYGWRCEAHDPCYPQPPDTRCGYAPFTQNWLDDAKCVKNTETEKKCCYNIGASYGYDAWYDWGSILIF